MYFTVVQCNSQKIDYILFQNVLRILHIVVFIFMNNVILHKNDHSNVSNDPKCILYHLLQIPGAQLSELSYSLSSSSEEKCSEQSISSGSSKGKQPKSSTRSQPGSNDKSGDKKVPKWFKTGKIFASFQTVKWRVKGTLTHLSRMEFPTVINWKSPFRF